MLPFVLNRGVEPAEYRPLFGRVWLNRVGIVLRNFAGRSLPRHGTHRRSLKAAKLTASSAEIAPVWHLER